MAEEKKKTILCVDDEQDILDSLYDTFMDKYDVKIATSGAEALKIFAAEDICVVITDQRMPQMQGTELLAKIREMKSGCKSILLTGYADINAAIDAINKGAVNRYFSKPWDDAEINDAVSHLVKMYDSDKFLIRMKEDGERLLKQQKERKQAIESYEKFLDGFLAGVCIVGDNDRIMRVNKTGMEVLQLDAKSGIEGKDFKEIFLLTSEQKKEFHQKFLRHDKSPDKVEVKMQDGATAVLLASLTFAGGNAAAGDGAGQVVGIVFHKPSHFF
jgi:response regulator RpfG family c-di-GMP phosphodiesterase